MNWTGIHIYFTSNRFKLMSKCISPLLRQLISSSHIHSFFFVNYNEYGNHLRLRIQHEKHSQFWIEDAISVIRQYLLTNPSPIDVKRDERDVPNDTIYLIQYVPEINRYGGVNCIEIAEKQFENSSRMILSYLDHTHDESYNGLLNLAMRLHLSSAFAFCGGRIEEIILLFRFLFANQNTEYSIELVSFFPFERSFSDLYLSQKKNILPYVQKLWENISADLNDDQIIDLIDWRSKEKEVSDKFQKSFDVGDMVTNQYFDRYPVWNILASFIHMTNNRIGIANSDEQLITYFLLRSLNEMNPKL